MPFAPTTEITFGSGTGYFGRSGLYPVTEVLSDGRIAVAWAEYQYPGDGSVFLDFDVWTRILNADGSAATEATMVNDTRIGSFGPPQISALSDGGYVVEFMSVNRDTVDGTDEIVYPHSAWARSFTATGAAEGPVVQVQHFLDDYDPAVYNSILDNEVQGINAIRLADGGAILIYDMDAGMTWARHIGNDGQTLGDPVQVWNSDFSYRGVQLANGDVALISYNGQLTGYSVRLSGADLVSAPMGETDVRTFSYDPYSPAEGGYCTGPVITALPDGGFAVLYGVNIALGTPDDESLRIDRFDAGGGLLQSTVIPVPDDTLYLPASQPYQALGLPDGRVVVVWTAYEMPNATSGDIYGAVVAADGTVEMSPTIIVPNTTGSQVLGEATLLPDGNLFLVMTDTSNLPVSGVTDSMHGVFVEIPQGNLLRSGTDGDDLLRGGGGSDTLIGYGGSDTLYGMDGTDTLNGGAGDDFIFGGATESDLRDLVYGGDGNDSIDGGWGNDELLGGNGNDTIQGNFGADKLYGNDGDDVLLGAGGADLIFGNAGDDFINGGFGFDRLNGGTGADRFYHQGVAGHATDWIQDYAATEGDLLVCGIAGAAASDFRVNYATTPGAGAGGVDEAFVIYRPTGQILWALIDGGDQTSIYVQSAGVTFDLLA